MSNDKNNLVYREQLDDNVIEMLSEDIGSNYSLKTENTKTIVAALNEILGKDIICNAVGSPLLTTDTFAQMGEKIHVMVNDFKAKLLGLGVSVSSVDKMAVLIEKMGEIDLGVDADELLAPLEESLREILGDEGVELSGNENLADLIVKVDEVFDENKLREEANKQAIIEALNKNGIEINGDKSFDELLNEIEIKNGYIIRNNDVKQVACGGYYTFILKNDGSLWACGRNMYGSLGLGDTNIYKSFIQVTTNINNDVKQVSCGTNHTYILKNDGSLWSCGCNTSGQLGSSSSDSDDHTTFTQVTTNINNDVKEVICNGGSVFIIKNDGSLWACGANNYGYLGTGSVTGSNNSKFGKTTITSNDIKQVASGSDHTFVLTNDGSLWSCGHNYYGNLGYGPTGYNDDHTTFAQVNVFSNDIKQVSCGNDSTFILKNDGSLWSCGNNESGQLGLGDVTDRTTFTQVTTNINNDIEQVICNGNSTFILKNDGSLWSCGNNESGQLGLGDVTDRTTFTQVTTNINNDIEQVICNGNSTFILKNDGSLWSCGYNGYGQLGLDNIESKYVFTKTFNILNPKLYFE